MYRVSPVTYFVSALTSTGLAGSPIVCAMKEVSTFDPPSGQSCASYLTEYMTYAGGNLLNPTATHQCQFCPVVDTSTLLASLGIYFENRWRDLAISVAYNVFNVGATLGLYWLFRVPKS